MTRVKSVKLAVLLLVGAFFLSGCCRDCRENEVETSGTVKSIELEGGFFGLVGDDGQNYDPINLPDEYRIDNLRVYFKGLIRPDLASIHQWGIMLELTEITRLN